MPPMRKAAAAHKSPAAQQQKTLPNVMAESMAEELTIIEVDATAVDKDIERTEPTQRRTGAGTKARHKKRIGDWRKKRSPEQRARNNALNRERMAATRAAMRPAERQAANEVNRKRMAEKRARDRALAINL